MAKNGVFLNYVSEKLLHENERKDGKGSVINVTVPCGQSATGFASFAVNPGQIFDAIGYQTKQPVEGFKSVLLGAADKTRKLSIATGKKKTPYDTIEMTNADIVAMVKESRAAYRASLKAPAEADAE